MVSVTTYDYQTDTVKLFPEEFLNYNLNRILHLWTKQYITAAFS